MNKLAVKQIPHTFQLHGDVRHDEYYWLKDKSNPEVIAYLEKENSYYEEVMKPLKNLTTELYEAMVARIPASETQIPIQRGPYFYYSRLEKEKQYPIYARKRAANRLQLESAAEEITLDENVLANGDDYLSVTVQRYSEDHHHLAYLENRDGTDSYTLFVKDLQSGELLKDTIPNVYIYSSVEWSNCGQFIFYVKLNELQRPYQVWRHEMGTDYTSDELLYEETDVTFNLYINKSRSARFIFIVSQSTTTSEVQIIDADEPAAAPKLFEARREGIEYDVEHWENDLLLLTNENALNFTLLRCSLENFNERTAIISYDENRFIENIYPFKRHIYVTGRENGLEQVWRIEGDTLVQLKWDEAIYSVSLVSGQDYEASEVLVQYESFLTPKTIIRIDIESGEKEILQEAAVTGEYDRGQYVQRQVWATAADGVKVPVLLHYQKNALDNGPAPLILNAYGSYGYSSDPFFSAYRLPILDKGVIMAVAQVRGGSELGRTWYFDGKMQKKRNSFTDFIDAANYLIDQGITTTELIAARGGSAGGLLVGAVANMAGDRFKVIVPEVPFVDIVTTMLDDTIPLTTLEWDEWGNPQKDADYFYMKSYSPYDNVEAKPYPHMYITTGLNDPRVGYWEPAKWVARLRELKTDDNTLVLKTNMGAGHFGASGRFNQLRELAEGYSFILSKFGY
ncbi:S9 family peptidase [Solibacillus sp. FSL W7-1436]|uniref:S9 family peptidase n=1 Tax=Solibacillus sp. FSL W7-1436 TaxID=2921705 RepID=UPI0030F5DA68